MKAPSDKAVIAALLLLAAATAARGEILFFTSPDCIFCEQIRPKFEEFRRAGMAIREIDDVSEAARWKIYSFPTFVRTDDDGQVAELFGGADAARLVAMIEREVGLTEREIIWPYEAVCDIQVGRAGGSGTYIGKNASGQAAIVTCAHVFEDGGSILCKFPKTGQSYPGRLLSIDRRNDLAMVSIAVPANVKPVWVGEAKQGNGPFVAVGVPWYAKDKPHFASGSFVALSNGELNTTAEFHSGYSGGAVLDKHGRLVGVAVGNNGVPGRQFYQFDRSRSVSGRVFIDFVSKWVKVYP